MMINMHACLIFVLLYHTKFISVVVVCKSVKGKYVFLIQEICGKNVFFFKYKKKREEVFLHTITRNEWMKPR